MSRLNETPNPIQWWNQFPQKLQLIATGRLWASIGAGGVLYLSPLLFNELGFTGSEIGSGITIAAILGTISRLSTGYFLDKGISCAIPLKIAALIAVIADVLLFNTHSYINFIQGQCLLGTAAGIYWPSAELAVPINCQNYPSSKGFALVRTADALGISLGSMLGTLASWMSSIRFIYLLDIFCMFILFNIVSNKLLNKKLSRNKTIFNEKNSSTKNYFSIIKRNKEWIKSIIPIIIISLFTTSVLSLLQSGLPLDLVKGGLFRPPLNETFSGLLLALQLLLLLIFQWPIGLWLSQKDIRFGLKFSLICSSLGCFLLSMSSGFKSGIFLVLIALVLIALGLTSFLPTATEGIIKISSLSNRGIAMALFSQCFGISSIIAPITSGQLIDHLDNGIILWLLMSIIAITCIPLANKIKINP